jgi:HD-like signal output (HDOD) protein
MGYISVDQLKPDMVLSEDVKDLNTRLLLSKGTPVQPNHIRMFKMWGITEVMVASVQEGGVELSAEGDLALIEHAAKQAKFLFKMNDLRHPLIKELFSMSVVHRAKTEQVRANKHQTYGQQMEMGPTTADDIRKTIAKRNIKLPEIPSIVYELNDVIADPFSSADDIAIVVNKSPSLASLLLKIVNSAFYGFPSRIDSISRAVTLIGSKEISSLGLGISTMSLFKEIPKELIDVKAFFKHCLSCGILSRILAAHLNIQYTEQFFVAGLLHDIGRVIIFKYFPQQATALLKESLSSGQLLYAIEPKLLGCRHTHVGRDLFNKWKLPYSLENSTYYHHTPSRAPDPVKAGVIHLADLCIHGLGLGSSGEVLVPPLDEKCYNSLGITPGDLKAVLPKALLQLNTLESVFQE